MLFKQTHESSDESQDMAEINIIPLVDVMLVLLIIFMVAAPLSITGIPLELPKSAAKGITIDEQRIVLSVSSRGQFFVDRMEIKPAALLPKLKAIYQFRQKKEILIRADRGVTYGRVVDAMSAAKLAGVNRIAMLTEPKAGTSAGGSSTERKTGKD
jgi:biopolymer transport protein TolR